MDFRFDWPLLFLGLILILILVIVYIIQRLPKTQSLQELWVMMQNQDPQIRSFTLSSDRKNPDINKRYTNVLLSADGRNIIVKHDRFPVDHYGKSHVLKPHGSVYQEADQHDGFRVDGIKTVFTCPKGYSGLSCESYNICDGANENDVRPITREKFYAMGVYPNIQGIEVNANPNEQHKRLRIRCVRDPSAIDGQLKPQIEGCSNDEDLDANLRCKSQDICKRALDGFTHNYPQVNPQTGIVEVLAKNEYYQCINGVSIKQKCQNITNSDMDTTDDDVMIMTRNAPSAVYSNANKTCIPRSICYGQLNGATVSVPGKPHEYVTCHMDRGHKTTCKDGNAAVKRGESEPGSPDLPFKRHYCPEELCYGKLQTIETDLMRYASGIYRCENGRFGERELTQCSTAYSDFNIKMTWAETDTYIIHNWPNSVYDERSETCVSTAYSPDNNDANAASLARIIYNPIVNIHYTKAMQTSAPYNLITGEFVCPEDTQYQMSFPLNRTHPKIYDPTVNVNQTHKLIYTLHPCQKELIPYPFKLPVLQFPDSTFPLFFGERAFLRNYWRDSQPLRLWPVATRDVASQIRAHFTQIAYTDNWLMFVTYNFEWTRFTALFNLPDEVITFQQYAPLKYRGWQTAKKAVDNAIAAKKHKTMRLNFQLHFQFDPYIDERIKSTVYAETETPLKDNPNILHYTKIDYLPENFAVNTLTPGEVYYFAIPVVRIIERKLTYRLRCIHDGDEGNLIFDGPGKKIRFRRNAGGYSTTELMGYTIFALSNTDNKYVLKTGTLDVILNEDLVISFN